MTLKGLLLVGLVALLAAASNLMLRGGVARVGGFGLAAERFFSDLLAVVRDPLVVGAVVLLGVAGLVWLRVISAELLSSAYPLLIGLSFVLVTVGAVLLFHEPLSWLKVLGVVVIIGGIVLVARA